MTIHDPLYGAFTIHEPVLIKLLQDSTVVRLKGIRMGGVNYLIDEREDYSRFEHSVGCMLLVRHLGASLEEQIAALLHDISHTAFSHVIDYVYKKGHEQDHHEHLKDQLVEMSQIPHILKKYSIDVDEVLDEHNFKLLEQPAPKLCADRIDYTLHSIVHYWNKLERAQSYLEALGVYRGEIVFMSKDAAVGFTGDLLKLDKEIFTDPKLVTGYYITADLIQKALDKGFITEVDFLGNDEHLMGKLRKIKDQEIEGLLGLLTPGFKIQISDEQNYDYHLKAKARFVNPKFLENGGIFYVFDAVPELEETALKHKAKVDRGIFVKLLK